MRPGVAAVVRLGPQPRSQVVMRVPDLTVVRIAVVRFALQMIDAKSGAGGTTSCTAEVGSRSVRWLPVGASCPSVLPAHTLRMSKIPPQDPIRLPKKRP